MKKKLLLSLIAACGMFMGLMAQNKTISGTVTGTDGAPIAGATVVVEGTSIGTTTDAAGHYTIAAPSDAQLNVSFIGYKEQIIAIAGKSVVNVELDESHTAIDDVVVVAFGQAKKGTFTGSAGVVKADDLSKSQNSNIASTLAGAVPGVVLSSSSGQPGSAPSILIRGLGSVYSSHDPLWIIDGQPYYGDLSLINPADIESITVLKDAASTALYGSSGANGVIMVTTKRGTSGSSQITFDAKWGVNSRAVQRYDYISNPAQYYETYYKGLYDYYLTTNSSYTANKLANNALEEHLSYIVYDVPENEYLIGTNGRLNPGAKLGRHFTGSDGNEYLLTPDDWEKEAFRSSLRQEYNLSASGANEHGHFFTSFGYLNDQGIVDNSFLERLTGRLNAEYQLKRWLKIGANASYSHYKSQGVYESADQSSMSTVNLFTVVTTVAPIYPMYVRDGEGNIMKDANGFNKYDYGDADDESGYPGLSRNVMGGSNAVGANLLDIDNANDGNAFTGSAFAEITFLKDFDFRFNAGMNVDEYRTASLTNRYYGGYSDMNGMLYKSHGRTFSYNLQQLLNYTKKINGVHNINVLVGHENTKYKTTYLWGQKSNMFSDSYLELSGAAVEGSSSSGMSGYNKEGYFARGEYNYDDRYIVNGMYRRDASSRFAPEHRWGNFWAISGAWVMNREKWFNADWVDLLKVKVSYGLQGNDGIGDFRYADRSQITSTGGEVGVVFTSKGNRDITWETNASFNAGVDFSLWNGRLSGTVEAFHRKTKDMLFPLPAPSSIGYSSYYANIGDMHNTGVEVDLSGVLIQKRRINWVVNLNMTHYKNKIDRLPEELIENERGYQWGNYWMAEGTPMYSFYMREFAGVDENGIATYWTDKLEADNDGNPIWTKTTDYNSATYRQTGKSAIPKLTGGFGTSLELYGVDFSINFTYQIGGWGYDYGYYRSMGSPTTAASGGYNIHKDILKAWTPENSSSNIPRYFFTDQYSFAGDMALTDASYLNLQNINVGYTLPGKWTRQASIQKIRIYCSCENVYYWSKRKGFDPRQSFNGMTNDTLYSPIRTISGGLTVTF